VLTGMADIRAHRWVQVDEGAPTVLEINAQREGAEQQVRVEVREVRADGMPDAMLIEGTMVFGAGYEPAPAPMPFVPANTVRTVKTARQMYDEMWMFHGPRFQGVASLDLSGDDGIIGQLEVLPTHDLFRSTDHPRLLTDAALLDAAGQLLGYWAKERLDTSFVIFPIRVAAVRIYGPNLPVGTRVYCQVRLTEVLEQTVKVDMEVLDPRGALWMRIEGWQDWRFNITGAVYDFWRFPIPHLLSKPLPLPTPRSVDPNALACYQMETLTVLGQTMISKSVAYMVLNHSERRVYHELRGPTARQVEWLAGRIAAKDAVRAYVLRRYGLQVPAGDIEIVADEHGRPEVRGAWLHQLSAIPSISLAHADGKAVAIAGDVTGLVGIGIDVQGITTRPAEFDEIAFTPAELALLHAVAGPARDERRMRFWCAKEAVAKALGRGLMEGPRAVAIDGWDEATGVAYTSIHGALADAYRGLAGTRLIAYTTRTGDHIVAASFGESL
jgi:phosphopantetheinyl transferase